MCSIKTSFNIIFCYNIGSKGHTIASMWLLWWIWGRERRRSDGGAFKEDNVDSKDLPEDVQDTFIILDYTEAI